MSRADYQRTRSGKYRKQFIDPVTGRRRSLTADTPAQLQALFAQVNDARVRYRYGDLGPREATQRLRGAIVGRLTVEDIWNAYSQAAPPRSRRVRDATWRHRFAPAFGSRAATELGEGVMREWLVSQEQKGLAPKTIRNAYDLLACAFRLAVRDHKLTELPWGTWRPPPLPRGYNDDKREAARSVEEFAALVAAARAEDEAHWRAGRYSAHAYAVLVMGLCGLRQGEAAGLAWECLDLDASPPLMRIWYQALDGWPSLPSPPGEDAARAAVRPLHVPKNGRRRLVLHEAVVHALRAQRAQLDRLGWLRDDGPVFPGKAGQWRTHAEVIDPSKLRQWVEAAGLPNVRRWTTHSLRHSFATLEVIASEGDLRRAQGRTGHSSVRQLEAYLHASGRGLPGSALGAVPGVESAPPAEVVPIAELAGKRLVELATDAESARAQADAERREKRSERRREEKKRTPPDFDAHARSVLAGDVEGTPTEIAEYARRAYQRAYMRSVRDGGTPEQARRKGQQSERATLAAFAAALKRAERAGLAAAGGAGAAPGVPLG